MKRGALGRAGILWGPAFAIVVASAVFARTASAIPAWNFEGKKLIGSETIVAGAEAGYFAMPGLTTKCQSTVFAMTISNVAKVGQATVTGLSLTECETNEPACTVDAIEAEGLPWPAELTILGANRFIVVEEIEIGVVYGGEECVLTETPVPITGTAGGLIDNETEAVTLDSASFETTGSGLSAFGEAVNWNGFFFLEATGERSGQALTVS
jgi:hypothetical protein